MDDRNGQFVTGLEKEDNPFLREGPNLGLPPHSKK